MPPAVLAVQLISRGVPRLAAITELLLHPVVADEDGSKEAAGGVRRR
jgi:hypothetical protein